VALVAEHDGARIGIMRALDRHVERVFNPSRKDNHWRGRKLARGLVTAGGPNEEPRNHKRDDFRRLRRPDFGGTGVNVRSIARRRGSDRSRGLPGHVFGTPISSPPRLST